MEDVITLNLLTWNLGSRTVKGESTKGRADRKTFLISHIYKQHNHHLAFFQEIPVREKEAQRRYSLPKYPYYTQTVKHAYTYQAGIALPPYDVECTPEDISTIASLANEEEDDQFADYLQLESTNDRKLMRSDIPPRTHVVRLRFHRSNIEILAVSFHSIYVYKDQMKYRYITLFFNLMCRLADEKGRPVLVGGDFNLAIPQWKWGVERIFKGRVQVADCYESTCRGEQTIDTFAVVYPEEKWYDSMKIRCTFIDNKPAAVETACFNDRELCDLQELGIKMPVKVKGKRYRIPDTLGNDLDHDPVVTEVRFTKCVMRYKPRVYHCRVCWCVTYCRDFDFCWYESYRRAFCFVHSRWCVIYYR